MIKDEEEFLKESNAIEGVYDETSLQQAIYAWEYVKEQPEITPHDVLRTHKILMLHQKLFPHEKGYFRQCAVHISGSMGMNHRDVPKAIMNWCDEMNIDPENSSKEAKETLSRYLHVEYEKIHPFVDGNGRTGRIFMNWWRLRNGLPVLVVHEGKEQIEYYRWFK